MGKLATLAAVLALGGCASPLPPVASPKAIWCENNSPQRPSREEIDTMGQPRLAAVLAHNKKGALWCGWNPKQ